jgi:hypothetical protein
MQWCMPLSQACAASFLAPFLAFVSRHWLLQVVADATPGSVSLWRQAGTFQQRQQQQQMQQRLPCGGV